jgi:hypothetical protein
VKLIKGRSLVLRSGHAPDLRIMGETGFASKDSGDLYQHEEGFLILVHGDKFEVSAYKNGRIHLKRIGE